MCIRDSLTVPHFTDRHTSSGHLYLLRIPGIGVDRRNALIVQMAERGIATNVNLLSGDDYPHRIPKRNDEERMRVYKETGEDGLRGYLGTILKF